MPPKKVYSRGKKARKKSSGISLTTYFIIACLIGLVLTMYIGYQASISDRQLFSISLLAMFGGLLFESFRISNNWLTVIKIFVIAYLLSLLCFLPGKQEHDYNFEKHTEIWPYCYIFIFSLVFGVFHKNSVTTKLSEGVTLLLSISLIYWVIDFGLVYFHHWILIFILVIVLLFCAFSILNALTYIPLTRTVRLTLSIWSTIIMFAFAFNNIISVFSNPNIKNSRYLTDGLSIGLQYFLLGISVVYIMRNYMMLAAFMPVKKRNGKLDFEENKKDHLDRYSDQQANIRYSLFCILFAGIIYGLNYKYQILPRHTAIWLVFLICQLILQFTGFINRREKH